MLDPRIYRAAFLPVALALVVVAFSLQARPSPLATTLAPDAFDGARAFGQAEGLTGLAARFGARRPGGAGDEALAGHLAGQFAAAGFDVRRELYEDETVDGPRELQTVIAERAGTSDERVVVVAHRDAAGRGGAAELSGTAALLELARVFGAPRRTARTRTLVSTSGGSGGAAGARRLAEQLDGPINGVLVLGDLASAQARGAQVVPWSNDLGAASLRLRRTVQEAVATETGREPGTPRGLSQLGRFAFPITLGEQGPMLEDGLPAVLLSVSGERGPPPGAEVSRERLEDFGRAALRTVTALDERALGGPATTADLLTRRNVIPGWAVRLLVGALLLPPLVAAVDAFARVRRRREPVGAWLRWTLAGALPFAGTGVFVLFLGLVGLVPDPAAPVAPSLIGVEGAALAATALVFALGWLVLRPLVLRAAGAQGDPASPGAGAMVILVLCLAAVVVWVINPYAAALLVPAAHLWLFAVAPEFRMRRAVGLAVVALGLAPLALLALGLARALGLDLDGTVWLALLLVAGGHVSAATWLLWSVVAACGVGALLIAARGPVARDDEEPTITVRGPRTYAGPGSLGGTESALRQ